MTAHDAALAELQNRLTKLLLTEPRDLDAIIEAADAVRRAERQELQAERGGRHSKAEAARSPDRRGSHFLAQSD